MRDVARTPREPDDAAGRPPGPATGLHLVETRTAAPRLPGGGGEVPALALVLGVAVVALAAPFVATRVAPGWLWGGDAYAFLPPAAIAGALGAAVVLAALAMRPPAGAHGPLRTPRPGARSALVVAAGLLAAGLVFWAFRTRHVLLGDGIPITALLPDMREIHPREPLAMLLQQGFYRLLSPLFAHPGEARASVVADCVAAGSVLAGMLFVVVARALVVEITRSFRARDRQDDAWLGWMLTLAILAQGYVQMFFGYVENYAFPVAVAALTLAASLRFLRGEGSILAPLGAAALGVALDFSGVVLGPSVLVLVAAGLLDRARRRTVGRDLALATGATLAVLAWLAWGPAHYSVVANLAGMLASGHAGADYLFSARHVRDFLNEQLLQGPFGLLLFVPVAAAVAATRERPGAATVFVLVAGLAATAACWATPELPMGYARDWDLFTPLGLVLAGAALALTMRLARTPIARRRTAAIVAVVSLFHTVPWIALNADEARSLERFKTLPLPGGLAQSTVAFWYAQHGDRPEAKRWLGRSLAINPLNSRALDLYGRIALEEHDARLALRAYLIAVTLRPDKPEFRSQLAIALAASGGAAAGLREVDALMAGHEDDAGLWLERAMLLHASGREAESAQARRRALELRPALGSVPDRLPDPASP